MHIRGLLCTIGLVAALGGRPAAGADEARFTTLGGQALIPLRWTAGCGTDAVYVCLELNSVKVRYADLVAKAGLKSPTEPLDLSRLWQLARDCGAHAQAVKVINGPDVLRKIMQDAGVRTAIVHLRAVENEGQRAEEHFSAVVVAGDTLKLVGADSYERDAARDWQARWSGAALLVSARPIGLAGPAGAPQPQMFMQPSKFDCGRVYAGSQAAYRFSLENRGDGDLEILDVKTGCACSTPTLGERRIHPQQATTLEGFVDAGPTTGRRTVQLTVFGTDPERPQIQADVTLDVVALPIRLSESKVVMSTSRRTERAMFALAVDCTEPDAPIRVARVEASADWLTAELSADARQIVLRAEPLESGQSRTATLTLHTAEPEAVLKIPVEVQFINLVECRPTELYLDRASARGQTIRRVIELRPRSDVTLVNVTAELRGVAGAVKCVRRVEAQGLWEVELEFTLPTGQTSMTVGGVEIRGTLDGDAEKLEVPVYVR